MTEEIYYESVVIMFFFFTLRKVTNCVQRDRMNVIFAREWNFTVDLRQNNFNIWNFIT